MGIKLSCHEMKRLLVNVYSKMLFEVSTCSCLFILTRNVDVCIRFDVVASYLVYQISKCVDLIVCVRGVPFI